MVHALETIHNIIWPNGFLIDLRPKGFHAEFWGQNSDSSAFLGYLQETDNYIEYRHAAWAMEQAIDNKWFHLEASGEYDFVIHAGSFDEIKTYLAVEWMDAVIPPEVQKRSDELHAKEINLRDLIHIGILRSM